MCGIVGFWDFSRSRKKEEYLEIVTMMTSQVFPRGPDSGGVWCDENLGLVFGHRRLAIVDRSSAGDQPMISQSGNSVIIYNGEIYNWIAIRSELEKLGVFCRSYTDTEVLLEACELWGLEATIKRMNGMFAFAYWNKRQEKLYLVRDRLGIKPLFWGLKGNIFYFASQLNALIVHPDWEGNIDRQALTSYFRFNYIPAPLSIYQGVYKLEPGRILIIDTKQHLIKTQFWSLETVCQNRVLTSLNELEAIEKMNYLIRDAVKCRMYVDLPLGAFLSGGIDSSTIVALMQAQSERPIKTFSIGFYDSAYNEGTYAKAIAQHLKTEHYELYLHVNEAVALIPHIPEWYDEPFADSSQIPTYLVSRLAKEHVSVILSGDGGDELFSGYNRYILFKKLWSILTILPHPLKKSVSKLITSFNPATWDKFFKIVPRRWRPLQVGDRVHKLAFLMQSPNDFYKSLMSFWERPSELVIDGSEILLWPRTIESLNFVEQMQYVDSITYLPDDILTKVDRASMAVSLEARIPLLDYRLVEFVWALPSQFKLRNGQTKWILRRVLEKYVPAPLFERPKAGFGVPIDDWLRVQLREWAEDLLSVQKLRQDNLLNFKLIRQRWEEHLLGKRNWHYSLWGVLMFQLWRERRVEKKIINSS